MDHRRRAWQTAWRVLALCALLSFASSAHAGDIAADKARIDAQFYSRLDVLVETANGLKLYASRNRLLLIILRVQPNHARARSLLGWKKSGKEWVRAEGWKEPHDWNADAKPSFDAKVTGLFAWYRDQVMSLIEGAEPTLDPKVRAKTLRGLSRILPQDRLIGEALGYEEFRGAWVHPETQRTMRRREELAAFLEAAKVSPRPKSETAAPNALLKSVARAAHVLVRGAVEFPEVRDIATEVNTAQNFVHSVFKFRGEFWSPEEILVFANLDDAKSYFLWDPRLGESAWKLGQKLSSMWIRETGTLLIYIPEPADRLLDAVHQAVASEIPRVHGEDAKGWVLEGLGQYLTWQVTGKHPGMFARISQTGGLAQDEEEAPEKADWLEKAFQILDRPPGPDRPTLKTLLVTRIGGMTRDSTYLAFAFAQYLEEARTADLVPFISANAASESPDAECESVLGMDATALEERLRDWLEDTR